MFATFYNIITYYYYYINNSYNSSNTYMKKLLKIEKMRQW